MKLAVTAVLLFFSAFANAQEAPIEQPAGPAPTQISNPFQNFRFGLIYSMADAISSSGTASSGTSSATFTEKDKTTGQFGILIENIVPVNEQSSFTFGLTYELERTLTSYEGSVGSTPTGGTFSRKPTLTVTNLYGNFGLAFGPSSTIYAGLGYSFLNLGNSYVTAKGTLGYQFGVDYELLPKKHLMLEYRFIKGTGDGTTNGVNLSIDKSSFDGIVLGFKVGM